MPRNCKCSVPLLRGGWAGLQCVKVAFPGNTNLQMCFLTLTFYSKAIPEIQKLTCYLHTSGKHEYPSAKYIELALQLIHLINVYLALPFRYLQIYTP